MKLIEMTDMIGILIEDIGHTKIPLQILTFQINAIQSRLVGEIADQEEDLFIATATHTPSTSGVTLPVDFLRARDISVNGYPVELILPGQRHEYDGMLNNWLGNNVGVYYAYLRGNKIYYSAGMSESVSFIYNRRLPHLHRGRPQAATSTTVTLASEALLGTVSATDDYYNNATIIGVSGPGAGEEHVFTDYVGSTKVGTTDEWTESLTAASIYEIKCELPTDPDFHTLLCDMVSGKLGAKGSKIDEREVSMILSQLSSRNSQNCIGTI